MLVIVTSKLEIIALLYVHIYIYIYKILLSLAFNSFSILFHVTPLSPFSFDPHTIKQTNNSLYLYSMSHLFIIPAFPTVTYFKTKRNNPSATPQPISTATTDTANIPAASKVITPLSAVVNRFSHFHVRRLLFVPVFNTDMMD